VAVVIVLVIADVGVLLLSSYGLTYLRMVFVLFFATGLTVCQCLIFLPKAHLLYKGESLDLGQRSSKAMVVPFEQREHIDDIELLDNAKGASKLRHGTKAENLKLCYEQIELANKYARLVDEHKATATAHSEYWTKLLRAVEEEKLGDLIDMRMSTVIYTNPKVKKPGVSSVWSGLDE